MTNLNKSFVSALAGHSIFCVRGDIMWNVSELSCVGIDTLEEMATEARGQIDNIYLHWTAGRYGQVFPDYHISIDCDGRIYLPANCKDLTQYRVHTWKRNSRSIAVTLCCGYGAIANNGWNADMGDYPVTNTQIEVMGLVVATLCRGLGIPIDNVKTHCEVAIEDGYGPYSGDPETRWDLWYIKDFDDTYKPGGCVIRGKARWYSQNNH